MIKIRTTSKLTIPRFTTVPQCRLLCPTNRAPDCKSVMDSDTLLPPQGLRHLSFFESRKSHQIIDRSGRYIALHSLGRRISADGCLRSSSLEHPSARYIVFDRMDTSRFQTHKRDTQDPHRGPRNSSISEKPEVHSASQTKKRFPLSWRDVHAQSRESSPHL